MKLSIITINYNNLEGLRKTASSVLSQKWRDFEWIIIDGGSTDGSRDLIDEIAARSDSQISYWCSERDKGVYNAMNKGILKAQGEYLNFMNSGDYFFDDTTLFNVFSADRFSDIIYGDHIKYSGGQEEYLKSPDNYKLSKFLKYGINHQSTFIKRTLFNEELYDESIRICSDWKLFLKWIILNKSFFYIGQPICRFEGSGLSSSLQEVLIEEKKQIKQELLSPIINIDIEELNSFLSFEELCELRKLLSKRRLYRRLCRGLVRFLAFLNKIGI